MVTCVNFRKAGVIPSAMNESTIEQEKVEEGPTLHNPLQWSGWIVPGSPVDSPSLSGHFTLHVHLSPVTQWGSMDLVSRAFGLHSLETEHRFLQRKHSFSLTRQSRTHSILAAEMFHVRQNRSVNGALDAATYIPTQN
jgi:hypothetical protein